MSKDSSNKACCFPVFCDMVSTALVGLEEGGGSPLKVKQASANQGPAQYGATAWKTLGLKVFQEGPLRIAETLSLDICKTPATFQF